MKTCKFVVIFLLLLSVLLSACSQAAATPTSPPQAADAPQGLNPEATDSAAGVVINKVDQCFKKLLVPQGDEFIDIDGNRLKNIKVSVEDGRLTDADTANGVLWKGTVFVKYIQYESDQWADEQDMDQDVYFREDGSLNRITLAGKTVPYPCKDFFDLTPTVIPDISGTINFVGTGSEFYHFTLTVNASYLFKPEGIELTFEDNSTITTEQEVNLGKIIVSAGVGEAKQGNEVHASGYLELDQTLKNGEAYTFPTGSILLLKPNNEEITQLVGEAGDLKLNFSLVNASSVDWTDFLSGSGIFLK